MIYFAPKRGTNMKNKFDAVFFDFDGTFADTGKGIFECLDYACEALGKPTLTDENRKKFIGPPLFDSFVNILNCTEEEAEFGIKKYREQYNSGSMLHLEIYEGIPELLNELKKAGIFISMCSSKPAPFIKKILAHYEMDKFIDYIACPAADRTTKSKEEMITESLRYFKIEKDKAVMIGDRKYDIEGAKKAGIKSIGVTYGYGSSDELKKYGADYIVNTVNDVRKVVFLQENI